jgi:hypothetical protein
MTTTPAVDLPFLAPPSVAGPVTWRPPTAIHGPESLPLRFECR